ncbi:helix-turn-helix domain-containing protein [Allomuricauda sp. SCSIO 65647]|uniref:helix-turn-helix domain-containing protein n=1 Tax=Allomuricauda sp. SCSIO 65647 TaxID=2908843 RepID=UPI001F1D059B|nr:helix-turn-helix transcriptional regulator [Muricauda sp. SCSIO 65647]UJH68708.1 helix-turn-helix domain-containing protein [Muricauda sp. SCSIO 65647]
MKQPELGRRIIELRKQKGLTQEELVELCNINVRTLQRIENGEVTPRSYTIKTILSALDEDYESILLTEQQESDFILNVSKKEAKSVHTLLTIALVSGILYLISSSLEGVVDYFRFFEDELVFGMVGSVLLKVLSMVFYATMVYGFLISGKLLKNYLMKIASVLLLMACLVFYLFDIVSFFNEFLEFEVVILAEAVTWGTFGILFGISILKSHKIMRPMSFFAGGMEILASFFLLTVVLSLVGWILILPTIILEVIFLYKVSNLVKKTM